jgi:hypothetical protein
MGILAEQIEKDRVEEQDRRRMVRFAILDGMLSVKVAGLPNVLGHIKTTATVSKALKGVGVMDAIKRELNEMVKIGFADRMDAYWKADELGIKDGAIKDIQTMLAYQYSMWWGDKGVLPTDEEVQANVAAGKLYS